MTDLHPAFEAHILAHGRVNPWFVRLDEGTGDYADPTMHRQFKTFEAGYLEGVKHCTAKLMASTLDRMMAPTAEGPEHPVAFIRSYTLRCPSPDYCAENGCTGNGCGHGVAR